MDHETRNKFENFCALAEIEEDPDKFVEISRDIVRILDAKQVHLNHQRPAGRVRYPTAPPTWRKKVSAILEDNHRIARSESTLRASQRAASRRGVRHSFVRLLTLELLEMSAL